MAAVVSSTCPLCYDVDEAQSMVAVEVDSKLMKGPVVVLLCRECARRIALHPANDDLYRPTLTQDKTVAIGKAAWDEYQAWVLEKQGHSDKEGNHNPEVVLVDESDCLIHRDKEGK